MNWLSDLNFSREYLLPIQSRVNLNFYSVSLLKKYVSKIYVENPEDIISSNDAIRNKIDDWNDVACFEGYLSAVLCFLYLIEDILYAIKSGQESSELDNYSTVTTFIRLLGSFNKAQRSTAFDDMRKKVIGDEAIFDDLWDIDFESLPDKFKMKLIDFCPPRQSNFFYSSWNLFCVLFFGRIEIKTKENMRNQLCSVRKMKFLALDTIDELLEKYLKKYHEDAYAFWVTVHLFIPCEFKLSGYEKIETKMNVIFPKQGKNKKLSWREYIKKEVDYNDDDKQNIQNILNHYKGKEELGVKIAENLLFIEKTGA